MNQEVQPRCPYFSACGGCEHQDVAYEDQLADKQELLEGLFGRPVPVRGQDEPFGYRNRMDFVCTPQGIGLRAAGRWDEVVDVGRCAISNQAVNDALATIRRWVSDTEIPLYDLERHEGFLRYVVLRGDADALQVALTTNGVAYEQEVADLVDRLDAQSVVWTLETSKSNQSLGDETHRVFGEQTITLRLADKRFLVDPHTFFQTSLAMAARAVERMREFVPDGALVHDLYCGVGVLGQCVADRVVGVEQVSASVERARENASLNGVEAEYFCADAAAWLIGHDPELVIVDPPRAGLRTGAQQLLAAAPELILYLSCNPKTQKRDLVRLERAYDVVHLEGFDFFAHTDHVECLAVLKRRT